MSLLGLWSRLGLDSTDPTDSSVSRATRMKGARWRMSFTPQASRAHCTSPPVPLPWPGETLPNTLPPGKHSGPQPSLSQTHSSFHFPLCLEHITLRWSASLSSLRSVGFQPAWRPGCPPSWAGSHTHLLPGRLGSVRLPPAEHGLAWRQRIVNGASPLCRVQNQPHIRSEMLGKYIIGKYIQGDPNGLPSVILGPILLVLGAKGVPGTKPTT